MGFWGLLPTGLLLLGDFGPEVCEIPAYLLSCPAPPKEQTAQRILGLLPASLPAPLPPNSLLQMAEGTGREHRSPRALGIKWEKVKCHLRAEEPWQVTLSLGFFICERELREPSARGDWDNVFLNLI